MRHNLNSGRLRHVVSFFITSKAQDENGDNNKADILVFSARADCAVKSGDQSNDYGTTITTEVVTVLMRNDSRLNNKMFMTWNNRRYKVHHIQPDSDARNIIVTCESKE